MARAVGMVDAVRQFQCEQERITVQMPVVTQYGTDEGCEMQYFNGRITVFDGFVKTLEKFQQTSFCKAMQVTICFRIVISVGWLGAVAKG